MATNPRSCATCAKVQRTIMMTDGAPQTTLYNCHAAPPFQGRAFPDVQSDDWCWEYQAATTLQPGVTVTINV